MSSKDYGKIVEVGLSNLYLQMLDMYVSALKKSEFSGFNSNFLGVFDGDTEIFSQQLKDKFVTDNKQPVSSNLQAKELLSSKYELYGVDTPADGFLNILAGASSWWKKINEINSGYLSHVEIFDFSNGQAKSVSDSSKSFSFSLSQNIGNDLNNFLIKQTKDQYFELQEEEGEDQVVPKLELEKVSNDFFFVLDDEKRSYHLDSASNRLYIRLFFNFFGAALQYKSVTIQGIQELPKIPNGSIKKNFLLKNFISGIDAFRKEFLKNSKGTPTESLLINFNKVKRIIKKLAEKKKLKDDSRISFVFTADYKFQSLLDENNKYIATKELKDFLKENIKINEQIAVLNSTNCLLGGKQMETTDLSIGNPANSYNHFTTNNESYKKQTKQEKIDTHLSSRQEYEYVGDIVLATAFEYVKKTVPGGRQITQLFRQFFNKIDAKKLIVSAAKEAAKKLTIADVRKIYFAAFIQSLDITEIIDCVVNQAGTSLFVSNTGNKFRDHEFELKILLYNRLSFFYNEAKQFNPTLFNFITLDDPLPLFGFVDLSYVRGLIDQIETARKTGQYELEQDLKQQYAGVLDSKSDINKLFQYSDMIPQNQLGSIYSTITSNEPQYKYLPKYIDRAMLKARDYPGFEPSNFISNLFKVSILEYMNLITGFEFQTLYDNIAKKNKKLKTSTELKTLSPGEIADIGESAKTSKSKLHEPIKFDWFSKRYQTFDLEKAFVDAYQLAYNKALGLAISQIVDLTTQSIFNLIAGDEEAFDNVDPDIRNELNSNDPVENIIGARRPEYSSPKEFYEAVKENVFSSNSIEDIECLLNKIASEISLQLQFKYLKDYIGPNDASVPIMKNLFATCGFDNNYSTITTFFQFLYIELEKVGGINILLDRINKSEEALSALIDICDDNLDAFEDDLKQIKLNEIEFAKDNLLNALTATDKEGPIVFGCSGSPDKKPLFPDFYSGPEIQLYNKLMSTILASINDVYNADISKFKRIILKQDTGVGDNINFLDPQENESYERFLETPKPIPDGESPPQDLQETLSKDQKTLGKVLNEIISNNQFLSEKNVIVETIGEDLSVYIITLDSISYSIIVNSGAQTEIYEGIVFQAGKTTILAYRNDQGFSSPFYTDVLDGEYNLTEEYITAIDNFSTVNSAVSGIKNYYDITTNEIITLPLFSYNLNSFLNDQANKKAILILDVILNSFFINFVNNVDIFYSTKSFSELPLKDNEASELLKDSFKRNYRDGGLLISDKLNEKYKSLRSAYQCFIEFDASPDPQQLSKLRILYQSLFNVLIMEGLLFKFLNLNENFNLSNEKTLQNIITNGVLNSFNTSITNIGNLQQSYESDIDLLYKLQFLEEKSTAGNTILEQPEVPLTPGNTDKKILYLAESNFEDVLNRFKSRINLVQPSVLSDNVLDSLKGYTIHNIYDNIVYDDAPNGIKIPYPVINGLKRGLIVQNYVDVRQNGQIFEEYKNNPKQLTKVLPFVSNDPDFSGGVNLPQVGLGPASAQGDQFIPGDPIFGFGAPVDISSVETEDILIANSGYFYFISPFSEFYPVYSRELFTSTVENAYPSVKYDIAQDGEGNFLNKIVPNDIDVHPKKYESNDKVQLQPLNQPQFSQYSVKWNEDLIRTQGKIKKSDFEFYYKFLKDSKDKDGVFQNLCKLNGPQQYYKKLTIGSRVSMVLDADNLDNLTGVSTALASEIKNLVSNYEEYLSDPTSLQAREIMKEKIGVYKDENGNKFLVIPLFEINENTPNEPGKEIDVLKNATDLWNENSETQWPWLMYYQIENQSFTNLQSQSIQSFFEFFPISAWKELFPLSVEEAIADEYGEKILNLFDKTKKQIIEQIESAKGFFGDDFVKDTPKEEPDYSQDSLDIGLIILQMFAGLVDPTWKTNWFAPGPITPIGFAAKILTEKKEAEDS